MEQILAQLTFLVIFVFVIASLLGFELITKVPPTLHTPLMSGSNAISGITVVGAIMCALTLEGNPLGKTPGWFSNTLAFLAIVFATINVVGGYMVTDRMLGSFKKKGK
ncbi:MAG: NAD(P) transhydrogenase subunit alpha [Planctomycetes bacterium]|nr:NAD(P) transhydrogenase subunit alpha [Planctomycetota bacterium]MBZ0150610.1 NAD(P) transhydrogenase subunit alpha [Planctomycetota bacterium]MCC7396831.1 NAD(P) transhydrogenase subunit alpha [Planctomycetota bacterium]